MNKTLIAALLAASLGSVIPASIAQTATPQAKGPQASHAKHDQHAKRPFQLPSERVEARLAYIQTALKITDAQKPQWETFAATLRKQAREADKRVQERRTQMADRSKQQHLSTIERLERRQRMMTAGAQRLNDLIAASKPLYAALNPDQKQIADGILSPRHGKGRHKGHHGMHGNA
jgi:hypothetical protein